jgi:hypothetical protein
MSTRILFALLLVSVACLVIQGFKLDDRLDAWLAARIEAQKQPGDDGCWLDMMWIAGWLGAFAIYVYANLTII